MINKKMINIKTPAFTMLELIFVIVILGIVASIGSSLIAKTYENYIVQRALHRASISTELAANQLVNRLTFRISKTTVARNPSNVNDYLTVSSIVDTGDSNHTVLEWIGYDNDSFSAQVNPGWSGYADVQNASKAQFSTPGSSLSITSTIISNLSNASVSLTAGGQRPAIFFNAYPNDLYYAADTTSTYGANCMGLDYASNDTSCVLAVTGTINSGSADMLSFSAPPHDTNPKTIYEHYQLAWSAYAIVPVQVTGSALTNRGFQATDTIYDLHLFYNYQPWLGEQYDTDGSSSLLVPNVSVFKFSESGGTLRFKICAQHHTIGTRHATVCKEKAVIR